MQSHRDPLLVQKAVERLQDGGVAVHQDEALAAAVDHSEKHAPTCGELARESSSFAVRRQRDKRRKVERFWSHRYGLKSVMEPFRVELHSRSPRTSMTTPAKIAAADRAGSEKRFVALSSVAAAVLLTTMKIVAGFATGPSASCPRPSPTWSSRSNAVSASRWPTTSAMQRRTPSVGPSPGSMSSSCGSGRCQRTGCGNRRLNAAPHDVGKPLFGYSGGFLCCGS